MKLLPATALLAISVGSISLAYPQHAVADCRDSHSAAGCVTVLRNDEVRVIDDRATTAATQRATKTPAHFTAKAATLGTDASATAATVAPLGLFGSTLVLLGYFRRKRSVHRQLG